VDKAVADPVHHLPPSDFSASIPFNPPNRGAPGQTRDAGSRPLCATPELPFTAIAPLVNWGETIAQRPTFWLYLPYAAGDVEFFLRDEQTQEEVFRHTFAVRDAGGIHPFTLPPSTPHLEPDKLYNWQMDFVCNPETGTKFRATGMIVRREPSDELVAAIATATPREQAILYAEAGLWYDALAKVAALHHQFPDDSQFAADWASLLTHPIVELGDLVDAPILAAP
jgi:hypothetical protein